MLLSDIHAAGIADHAVDHGDFALVAVADRKQLVERRGGRHVDPRRLHVPDIGAVHMSLGAYRIIEQPDLDTCFCLRT
jgi:hypothetical protein